MKGVVEYLLHVFRSISSHGRPYACFSSLWGSSVGDPLRSLSTMLLFQAGGTDWACVCSHMLWLDLMGSVEGRRPNGRLGVTARLAASQPPGLFVGYQFLSSLHRDAESSGLGKDLEIHISEEFHDGFEGSWVSL